MNSMNSIDWIGFLGVMLLLTAYFLSSFKIMKSNGLPYILLNGVGAATACFAAVLLHYVPFIILEGAWFIIAVVSLVKWSTRYESKDRE